MGAVNRAFLRNLARLYADGRPGGSNSFVVDSDAAANAVSLDTIINLKLASFYDLLVMARGQDCYVAETTVAILGDGVTSAYALPTNFYQLITVHLAWSANDLEILTPATQRARIALQNWNYWSRYNDKGYRLRGTQQASAQTIEFFPVPTSAVSAVVRYIPSFTPLADDTTTFDSVNGWENLVALAAAIDYRAIAEKPNADLGALFAAELKRVQGIADQRDAGYAAQVTDVQPDFDRAVFLGDRRWV